MKRTVLNENKGSGIESRFDSRYLIRFRSCGFGRAERHSPGEPLPTAGAVRKSVILLTAHGVCLLLYAVTESRR